jgi:integrase
MQGHESNHYPFLTPKELPDFFKALSGYTGSALVVLAARLLIITGLRTGELRGAFGMKSISVRRSGKYQPHA